MKILHLTLTRHWFDEIASGRKPFEYRHDKPYWQRRLLADFKARCPKCRCVSTQKAGDTCIRSHHNCDGIMEWNYRPFDEVHFRNGYAKDAPFMRVEWKGMQRGCPPKIGYGSDAFAIQLGKVLEKRNWP